MVMTDESREYFREHAGEWDNLRSGYFQEAVRNAAIARAYLRPEFKAADIGAGTGFMAAALAPLVAKVYAVDGSAEMLDTARRNLAGFDNITFLRSDGLAIDLQDGSLDAVFANMYLHHCPDPLAAIREMTRLLRPGGRLVITDCDTHPHEWMRAEMADVWLGFERKQIRDWFREAGLVNVIVDNTGETCCATAKTVQIRDEGNRQANVTIFAAVGARPVNGMKAEVAREYRRHALEGSSCGCSDSSGACCSGGEMASTCCSDQPPAFDGINYSDNILATAPSEAVEMSLGCGNPLAIGDLKPGETVVDIGSGAGLDSFLAANKVGPLGRVIGVDMTPEMIARARESAAKNGFTQVEFRLGQAEDLPVEDSSVDVILSNCVINLCDDKGRVFEEAFRVLKPGGRLEVSDVVSNGSFPAGQDGQGWAECINGALPESEYLDLIKQAGFTIRGRLRSMAEQKLEQVSVYSLVVSAFKPDGKADRTCCCS